MNMELLDFEALEAQLEAERAQEPDLLMVGPGLGRFALLTISDDSVAIMSAAPLRATYDLGDGRVSKYLYVPGLTPQFIRREIAKWVPSPRERALGRTGWLAGRKVLRFREIGREHLPEQRDFRNAWVERDGAIQHDMAKARAIYRQRAAVLADQLVPRLLELVTLGSGSEAIRAAGLITDLRGLGSDFVIDDAPNVETLRNLWAHRLAWVERERTAVGLHALA